MGMKSGVFGAVTGQGWKHEQLCGLSTSGIPEEIGNRWTRRQTRAVKIQFGRFIFSPVNIFLSVVYSSSRLPLGPRFLVAGSGISTTNTGHT